LDWILPYATQGFGEQLLGFCGGEQIRKALSDAADPLSDFPDGSLHFIRLRLFCDPWKSGSASSRRGGFLMQPGFGSAWVPSAPQLRPQRSTCRSDRDRVKRRRIPNLLSRAI
jgi:hypothetical protein